MISGTDVEGGQDNANTTTTSTASGAVTFLLGPKEISIPKYQIPYHLMIAASIVLLGSSFGSTKNQAYGISVAVITMVTAAAALFLSEQMKATWATIGIYVNYFLVLWNTVGAIILTFQGPYYATTNGYFAIWAMVVFSVMASNLKTGAMTEKFKSSSALGGLMMASIVLMVAIIFIGAYDWRMIYGLIVACVTSVVCAIFIYLDQKGDSAKEVKKPVLGIFVLLWVAVVIVLTFSPGLFQLTSNGFFASWAGLIFTLYAAATC
eukprot:CAMPEP_0197265028 /NCGR_PEP_ID=MMETSP1432-20130617/2156_1 /TAXON_ID=44447 /ORGANISM="Pseudo-nitzschia delicatissima, Strain UNC1205" /LENGTH=263 /DNA_ID=CAMNT_0042729731 /DNA_START=85 /DNA_END=876 /DNA_ORIENTATION=+